MDITTLGIVLLTAITGVLLIGLYQLTSRLDRLQRNQRELKREIDRLHNNEQRDKKLPRPNSTPDYWD